MKRALLSVATGVMFFAATAFAQSTPQTDTQGTQSSSPSMSQGSSSSSSGGMSQGSQGMSKGEKKMKGCIQSDGGQTVLREKSGKSVALTGQDLSAHVGHEVMVHGTWAGGDMSSSSGGAGAAHQFTVSSVDMISET